MSLFLMENRSIANKGLGLPTWCNPHWWCEVELQNGIRTWVRNPEFIFSTKGSPERNVQNLLVGCLRCPQMTVILTLHRLSGTVGRRGGATKFSPVRKDWRWWRWVSASEETLVEYANPIEDGPYGINSTCGKRAPTRDWSPDRCSSSKDVDLWDGVNEGSRKGSAIEGRKASKSTNG